MHSKNFIFDEEIAVIGAINLGYRSLCISPIVCSEKKLSLLINNYLQ